MFTDYDKVTGEVKMRLQQNPWVFSVGKRPTKKRGLCRKVVLLNTVYFPSH